MQRVCYSDEFNEKPEFFQDILHLQESPMLILAKQYLISRSLGNLAVLLSLAIQGVFRDIKDAKTHLCTTGFGDLANIILDPIFIFIFRLDVSGAALAHDIFQYLISAILLWKLIEQVDLLSPSFQDLQFGRFLKNSEAIIASAFAKHDYEKASATVSRVLQFIAATQPIDVLKQKTSLS